MNLPKLLTRLKMPDDEPIKANVVTAAIKSAQTQVEQQNFETRRSVLKYDDVMNEQRKVIYATRRRILEGEDLNQQVQRMMVDVITAYVDGAAAQGRAKKWDLDALWEALETLYPIAVDRDSLLRSNRLNRKQLLGVLIKDAKRAFAERESEIEQRVGAGAMRQLERDVLFDVIDRKWREHLYEMDYLKEGIGRLRALAQRDPVVEYQTEGYDMFVRMLEAAKEESVRSLFHAAIKKAPTPLTKPAAATPARLAAQAI